LDDFIASLQLPVVTVPQPLCNDPETTKGAASFCAAGSRISCKTITIMPMAIANPISQKEPVTNQSNHDILAFIFWSPPAALSEAGPFLSAAG
jgi:hypothetical protein